MILSKVKQFFAKNKKIFFYIALFLAVYYFFSETSFAAEGEFDEKKWIETITTILNEALGGLSILVGAITYFITLFLNPGWINGTLFGLTPKFKEIWILISNIVYFIFAGILIWIALMNILGKGDKWELKKALPKFIIGVLIVPFSWFFVQFVLSVTGYLTISILTLPSDIFPDYKTKLGNVDVYTECTIDFTATGSTNNISDEPTKETGKKFFDCNEKTKAPLDKAMNNSSFGLISMYTYGILNVKELKNIYDSEIGPEGSILTISNLLVKIVFNFLFVIVYMILFISLGLVLITRGMYLWIFTMFSPVFGLMYFFDKKEGGGEGMMKKFSIKEFISLAMVPVYVMLALSFGLFFINTITTSIFSPVGNTEVNIETKGGEDTISILGIFKLTIKSPLTSSANGGKAPINFFQVGKSGGQIVLGTIGTLILYMLGIGVLRVSLMAALRSSEITKEVVQPIYEFGNQVGSLIQKSPQYAPIFGGQSMKSMDKVAGTISGTFDTKASNKASKFLEGTPFGDTSKVINELQGIRTNLLNRTHTTHSEFKDDLIKTLSLAEGKIDKLYQQDDFQKTLYEIGGKAIGPDEMKKLGVEKFGDIDNVDKLTKLISAIKKSRSEYGSLDFYDNNSDSLKKYIEKLGNKNESNTSSSSKSKKESEQVINFNINSSYIKGGKIREKEGSETDKTAPITIISADILKKLSSDKLIGKITEENFRKELIKKGITIKESQDSIISKIKELAGENIKVFTD